MEWSDQQLIRDIIDSNSSQSEESESEETQQDLLTEWDNCHDFLTFFALRITYYY